MAHQPSSQLHGHLFSLVFWGVISVVVFVLYRPRWSVAEGQKGAMSGGLKFWIAFVLIVAVSNALYALYLAVQFIRHQSANKALQVKNRRVRGPSSAVRQRHALLAGKRKRPDIVYSAPFDLRTSY